MKKVKLHQFLIFSMAVFYFTACSENADNIPPQLTQALATKYEGFQNLKWEFNTDSAYYIANFDLDSSHYVSNFTSDGVWTKSEHPIAFHLIPLPVRESLELSFGFFTIENAILVENAKKVNWYKLELDSSGDEIDLDIEANGYIHDESVWNEGDFDYGD